MGGWCAMKVLVCGSRECNNFLPIKQVLDQLHKEFNFSCVVHGAAKGADQFAEDWANLNSIRSVAYPANWDKYGRRAGPIRNLEMITKEPDIKLVVAFFKKTAKNRGTKNMVSLAKEHFGNNKDKLVVIERI